MSVTEKWEDAALRLMRCKWAGKSLRLSACCRQQHRTHRTMVVPSSRIGPRPYQQLEAFCFSNRSESSLQWLEDPMAALIRQQSSFAPTFSSSILGSRVSQQIPLVQLDPVRCDEKGPHYTPLPLFSHVWQPTSTGACTITSVCYTACSSSSW